MRWNCGSSRDGDPLALDTCLHPPDGGHIGFGEGLSPYEFTRRRHEPLAEIAAPGDDAGPHQRLALPGLGPAVEVGGVPVKIAGQSPLATFGPEAEVESGHPLGRARAVHEAQQGLGDGFACLGTDAVVDEQQIQVAGIRHLRAAEAAHSDDGECHRRAR